MKRALVPFALILLFAFLLYAPRLAAAQPTRQEMQAAQTDALGTRRLRERTREEMEASQTDGLGFKRGKRRGDEEWFEPMRLNREDAGPSPESAAPVAVGSAQAERAADSAGARGNASSPTPTAGSVTAAGSGGGSGGRIQGGQSKGIVNGLGHAYGHQGRSADAQERRTGMVTGGGNAHSTGHAAGKGIVSAGGVAAQPIGAGIVTGAGTAIVPAAGANGLRVPAGIVNAAGGPPGHAKAHGRRSDR